MLKPTQPASVPVCMFCFFW